MSQQTRDICVGIVSDDFGELVAKVYDGVYKDSRQTLVSIARPLLVSGVPYQQTRESLLVLVHHGLVHYAFSPKGTPDSGKVVYWVDPEAAITRLRFSSFIAEGKRMGANHNSEALGGEFEQVMRDVCVNGRVTMPQLCKRSTSAIIERTAVGHQKVPSKVRAAVTALVKNRVLVRVLEAPETKLDLWSTDATGRQVGTKGAEDDGGDFMGEWNSTPPGAAPKPRRLPRAGAPRLAAGNRAVTDRYGNAETLAAHISKGKDGNLKYNDSFDSNAPKKGKGGRNFQVKVKTGIALKISNVRSRMRELQKNLETERKSGTEVGGVSGKVNPAQGILGFHPLEARGIGQPLKRTTKAVPVGLGSSGVESSSKGVGNESADALDGEVEEKLLNNPDTLWRLNVDLLMSKQRDLQIASFLGRRYGERAELAVRALLTVATRVSPYDYTTMYTTVVTSNQVASSAREVFGDKVMDSEEAEGVLRMLAATPNPLVFRESNPKEGYVVGLSVSTHALWQDEVCGIISAICGPHGARVYRLLRDKQWVELRHVTEGAMLPPKEARALVYQMATNSLLTVQDVAKTPDFAPMKTIFLYGVDPNRVRSVCMQRVLQMIRNIKDRLRREMEDHAGVMRTAQGQSSAALRDLMTAAELSELEALRQALSRLMVAQDRAMSSYSLLSGFR